MAGKLGTFVTFDELTKYIEELRADRSSVTVAVSGFAGSGKSTLATRLAKAFGSSDGQILRVDNFYAPEPRGRGLFDDYDWSLLQRVLCDIRSGRPIAYRGRGFDDNEIAFDESAPDVFIVEGIQLLHQDRMQYFDVSVWIDCPLSVALDRARARDRVQGHDDHYMKRWDTEWGPRNEQYFASHQPDRLATFRYRGNGLPT